MSAETTIKPHSKPKAAHKEKEKRTSQSSTASERLKVVVRRLPPNLPEDIFWQSVQPWVTEETVAWKTFYPGKLRKKLNKENIPSRAYVAFKRDNQLAAFAREYDGHLFRDKAGNESQAVVEFAPYQKVPSEKKKADARIGTIEKDEDYISFLESLKSASAHSEQPSMEALIAAAQPPPPPKTTPLLEALKAEKTAHRDKEVILRNHAHHKDSTAPPILAKKEEPKKKGAALLPPEQPQMSKKAAKRAAAAQRAAAQAQAAAAVVALATQGGSSKNAGASESAPAPKPATPKAPRAMREQQARQQAAKAAMTANAPAQNNVNDGAATTTTAPSTEPAPASPQSGQKRTRPVIAVASRQFEAALSGVGVSVGQSGGERKSRREREKNRERAKERQASGPSVSTSQEKVPSEDDPGLVRVDNPGSGTSGGNPETASTSPKPKITGILQRPDSITVTIPQRDEQRPVPQNPANPGDAAPDKPVPPAGAPEPGLVRGSGRRGRGRGRGSRRGGT